MSDARSEGLKVFADLQASLKDAQRAFSQLATEQNRQCQTIRDSAETASRIAVEASEAFSVSKPRLMIWTALCAALLVAGGWLAGYWLGHSDGWVSGDAHGYRQAIATNAGASWANTPSGQLAYQMDRTGLLQALGHCRIPGYEAKFDPKEKRSFCYPTSEASGWAVLP